MVYINIKLYWPLIISLIILHNPRGTTDCWKILLRSRAARNFFIPIVHTGSTGKHQHERKQTKKKNHPTSSSHTHKHTHLQYHSPSKVRSMTLDLASMMRNTARHLPQEGLQQRTHSYGSLLEEATARFFPRVNVG